MRVPVAVVLSLLVLAAPASARQRTLSVGAADMTRCTDLRTFFCGSLSRPLDPAKPDGKRIRIAFRWRAAAVPGRRSGPPIVAVEGGPGYPSGGSTAEFLGTFGPLLRTRDLLLVDNRGTGRSALIRCPRLQRYGGATSTGGYTRTVAACARAIDRRHGRGAHARFGTADAVDDLAGVLRHLRLPPVALYGDSYGSWFAQSFAARHPGRLNSVTLDSTYPVVGLDPFYASSAATSRDAFDAVCDRDPGCAAATAGLGTTATQRMTQLLDRLRAAPISGSARDVDGTTADVRVTPTTLVDFAGWAGTDPIVYRELDAAVRAALGGDEAPLVRLAVQAGGWNGSPNPAAVLSEGLYAAVSCTDYPQLWDPAAAPAQRRAQLEAAVAGAAPGAFSPFTTTEWLTMDAGTQPFRTCLDWPRPARTPRPPVPDDAPRLPADVPLLVVGGDLDSLTPLRDADTITDRLATTSRVVQIANTTHVTSQGFTILQDGTRCARRVIRGFLRAPGRVGGLDASCGAAVPHVHTPGAFPRTLADAAPAELRTGADPGDTARRAITVAAGAVADATIRRSYKGENGAVVGLRGGAVRFTGSGEVVRMRLRSARFVLDAAVSGTARWRPSDGAVSGTVTVTDELGTRTRVALDWDQRSRLATARVGDATFALPAP